MTNKEHLVTLEPIEWVQRVDWLYPDYGKRYTDSWPAIMHWLEQEYKSVKPMHSNAPESTWYFCPVCYMAVINKDKKCCKCHTDLDWSDVDGSYAKNQSGES